MPTHLLKISPHVLEDIRRDAQYNQDALATSDELKQSFKQGYQTAREEIMERLFAEIEDEKRRSEFRGFFYLTGIGDNFDRSNFPVDGTMPELPCGSYVATAQLPDGTTFDMMLEWKHREGIDTDDYSPRDIAELLREQAHIQHPEFGPLTSFVLSTFKKNEAGINQCFILNTPLKYKPLIINGETP